MCGRGLMECECYGSLRKSNLCLLFFGTMPLEPAMPAEPAIPRTDIALGDHFLTLS